MIYFNHKILIFFLAIFFAKTAVVAKNQNPPLLESSLTYSKTDHPGCPENAQCSQETGLVRTYFKEQLKLFLDGKISESIFNQNIKEKEAIPFPVFTKFTNESKIGFKNVALWESHCRQHKIGVRYYQGEIFIKNIAIKKWQEAGLIFNPLVLMVNKNFIVIPGLMGESPLSVKSLKNKWEVSFLRDEDGLFYLFTINSDGEINLSKVTEKLSSQKTINCPVELSAEYLRISESPSFYATNTCKEMIDRTTSKSVVAIFGVPCL